MIDNTSSYQRLGGETGVRALVERFYEYMDSLPEARSVRVLHPADLRSSSDKLFKFLSEWLGGPDLYMQAHGHPRLRARHRPFSIGVDEARAWLLCMQHALRGMPIERAFQKQIYQALVQLAAHMVNQPGTVAEGR